MTRDLFADRAADWDREGHRVDNVENIATAIRDRIPFEPTMEIMDFGSGTGLLLERVAPLVRKICAVDTSPSMNAQLADKAGSLGCELEILEVDLTVTRLERRFDLLPGVIISRPDASLYSVVDVRRIVPADFDALEFVLWCAREGVVEVEGEKMTLLTAPMAGLAVMPE